MGLLGNSGMLRNCAVASLIGMAAVAPSLAHADELYDFESPTALENPAIGGDKTRFSVTTDLAQGGTRAVKFTDIGASPFESFTYESPFDITSGTITVWFYDQRGIAAFNANPFLARWGSSIILEDKANPSDFGAVEICELSYGGGRYYGSEGSVDRGVPSDKFDSNSFPIRSAGFHRVDFVVGAASTTILLDGVAVDEIAAPGGAGRTLRLRFMADSASVGGSGNWSTSTTTQTLGTTTRWINYDDVKFDAELPAVNQHTCSFESSPTVEYDTAGVFMGPPATDNPYMAGSITQWSVETSATIAHAGTNSIYFANPAQPYQSLTIPLANMSVNTTATLWFYDTEGTSTAFNKFGGAIIVENGSNPADFIAAEIWNASYPASGDPTPGGANYYLTKGFPGSPNNSGNLFSRKFGNRGIGWHKVEIFLGATSSQIFVDGRGNDDNGAVQTGPGKDTNPMLRLMADSPTNGGFGNWVGVNELSITPMQTRDNYVYYDSINVPVPTASVANWSLYE